MQVRRTWLLAAVMVVAVAMAGCDAGGAGTEVPPPETEEAPPVSVSTTTAPSGGFAETMIAWHWQVEEEAARCMAERGFDYVPYVPQPMIDGLRSMYDENRIEVKPDIDGYWAPLLPMESSPVSVNEEETMLETARRTGFNIFFEPKLLGPTPEDNGLTANPNRAIVEALGDEELDEYWRALQGYVAGDFDGVNEPTEAAMEKACAEVARRSAGPEPLPPARLEGVDIEQLNTLGDKVYRLTQADLRLDAAEAERVACLADQGLPPYPYEYILGLLRSETERVTGDPQGVIEEGYSEAGMARAFGADRLRELQEEELAAAIAGNECAMPKTQVERELITEYEQQILAENPDMAALLNQDK